MYPRLFTLPAFELFGRNIGPLTLHTYGVLLALAFLAGLWVAAPPGEARPGLDAGRITDLAVYVLIAGLLGAKLAAAARRVALLLDEPARAVLAAAERRRLLRRPAGGLPVAWWYARRHELRGWRTADVLAPGVVLGQSIGRLGCFAAGCCYGRPTTCPGRVTFRDLYAARDGGHPDRHAAAPDAALRVARDVPHLRRLLLWSRSASASTDRSLLSYVLLYSVARFVIEFFRGDAARGSLFGGALSTSQFIAILLLVGAPAGPAVPDEEAPPAPRRSAASVPPRPRRSRASARATGPTRRRAPRAAGGSGRGRRASRSLPGRRACRPQPRAHAGADRRRRRARRRRARPRLARGSARGRRSRSRSREPRPAGPQPEDIPLTIVHEDAQLLVVDKPAGLVVHPGAGAASGTLVNALLHHVRDLSGVGGRPDWVPSGTFTRVLTPCRVGTSNSPPSAAVTIEIGARQCKSAPSRKKKLCGAMETKI